MEARAQICACGMNGSDFAAGSIQRSIRTFIAHLPRIKPSLDEVMMQNDLGLRQRPLGLNSG